MDGLFSAQKGKRKGKVAKLAAGNPQTVYSVL
jgi:hypothetical protein